MISPESLREIWFELEIRDPPPGDLRVTETALELPSGHPLFAIDAARHRHVLIPVAAHARVQEDRRSGGVHIVASTLLEGENTRHFVDVVCRKPHLYEIFSVIAAEMLGLVAENSAEPDRTCAKVLARWRELLEHEPTGKPSMEKLTGLFGELWYLRELVRITPGAVQWWTGPDAARHDLSSGAVAIEVKSTLVRHGRFFEIHGHEQLEPPAGGQLYLATLKLEQVQGEGLSVPGLVDSIVELGASRQDLLQAIMQVGINPADLELSRDLMFRVAESRVYEVDDAFPRIGARSFVGGGLPPGVLKLNYVIDLTSEPPKPLKQEHIMLVYHLLAWGEHL